MSGRTLPTQPISRLTRPCVANAGVPAYISGGGGAIPERMDGIGRHYLVVEVDPRVGVRTVGVTRVD